MQGHEGVAPYRWLSGLVPMPDFNPLLQMASGVYLTFFGSFVFGIPGFPARRVPLQQVAADAAAGRLEVKPTRIFRFEEIHQTHRVMEANEARGIMVWCTPKVPNSTRCRRLMAQIRVLTAASCRPAPRSRP